MPHDACDISPTVLVTGATGFVGRPIARRLVEQGTLVHGVARRPGARLPTDARFTSADLLDPIAARKLIREIRPSHLIATAWITTPGEYWESPTNSDWLDATTALVEEFTQQGGTRLVVLGSAAEYDWTTGERLRECVTPIRPSTAYGQAKAELHARVRAIADRSSISLAWARLFWLYGPGEHPDRLVPMISRSLLSGEPVATTAGTQVRDYLHVEDAADAIARLALSGLCGAINIGSGEGVPVRRIIDEIASASGRKDLVKFGARSSAAGDPDVLEADTSRLRRELGFRPSLSLEEGVRRTFAWWRQKRAA